MELCKLDWAESRLVPDNQYPATARLKKSEFWTVLRLASTCSGTTSGDAGHVAPPSPRTVPFHASLFVGPFHRTPTLHGSCLLRNPPTNPPLSRTRPRSSLIEGNACTYTRPRSSKTGKRVHPLKRTSVKREPSDPSMLVLFRLSGSLGVPCSILRPAQFLWRRRRQSCLT